MIKVSKKIIYLALLILIGLVVYYIFCIEIKGEKEQESNTTLPVPNRIVFKAPDDNYYIAYSDNRNFSKIYSAIYNEIGTTIEGQVLDETQVDELKKNGSFIEFDYDTISKNFVFPLEDENIGMIQMLESGGQVRKVELSNKKEIKRRVVNAFKQTKGYKFEKNRSYTSKNTLESIPSDIGLIQKSNDVYYLIIENKEKLNEIIEKTKFELDDVLPTIDYGKDKVILTITNFETMDIKENVGNIKYKLSNQCKEFKVNLLLVSKIVNTNCIYYNMDYSNNQSEFSRTYNNTTSNLLQNVYDNKIELGYSKTILTDEVLITKDTVIKEYKTNQELKLSDLRIGDSIYIEGSEQVKQNDLNKIEAYTIYVYRKEAIKAEVEKWLIDTYRIDGTGIEASKIDANGNGYIIVEYICDNFIYPIKLNVNSQTETFLGMGYHLQSNYGYIFHEMSDITLDTKITDIDNIQGYVKTIEYIAD